MEAYVGSIARASPAPASRSWRWREESSTLNSVEIAITRAPSVTDIRLRSTSSGPGSRPSTNRTRADQPLASAIGISGTAASRSASRRSAPARRAASRRAPSSTRNTPSSATASVSSRRWGDDSEPFASAASTGRPITEACTPGGGSEPALDVVHHLFLAVERHQANAECEVGGCDPGSPPPARSRAARRRAAAHLARAAPGGAEQVRQGERRAELGGSSAWPRLPGSSCAFFESWKRLIRRDARRRDVLRAHGRSLAGPGPPPAARSRLGAPAGRAARARGRRHHLALRVEGEAEHATTSPTASPRPRGGQARACARSGSASRSQRRAAGPQASLLRQRVGIRRPRRPRKRTRAAKPAHSAHSRAIAMPATSSRPKPRTIGTGIAATPGSPRRWPLRP